MHNMSLENNQQTEEKSSEEKLTPEQLLELSVTPEINPRTGKPLKPKWLKSEQVKGERLYEIKRTLREGKLFTVCEEARCPNISECWNSGTATFMILGDTCTRGCRFCAVKTGNPAGLLDANEPMNTALNIKKMKLDYAVITMVDRDDLPDGGAAHIAQTVKTIQAENPGLILEILAGDFQGREEPLREVLFAGEGVDVFAHNLETVRRLSPRVRDARAKYDQSLRVLENAKKMRPQTFTKSALMLGLGEEANEIEQSLRDMRAASVEIVTIGQYLQPSNKHLSIKRFVHPDEFKHWQRVAEELGFKGVASGPLVRSSYKAAHLFPERARVGRQGNR
jgi:lipoic acid synthetase